ncbi:MAG TPA: heme lyase CcmF/NrfE family subunit [Terriglobales bacterium]|jgi:cytochrome c-type biogenesis protein CcmF|nr:heme lyase CcmF/NrfE family subunit [Terriglobales bacterium]
MSQIGSFALLLALGLSSYSFLAGLLALFGRDAGSMRLGETARRAGIAAFGAVLLAAIVLVTAAFRDDFSISYIFHHSNRDLPAAYKFAVLWSGQEGSLLFWSLLLGGYGFVLRLRYKTDQRLFAHASVVIAAVQVFFLLLLNFAAHPFGIVEGALPPDGNGLNPLLQYPEMVIHPPMLYLGYIGFTIPFAFALGALIMKYPGDKWIYITRRWTMVTWCFLTIGVFLGAHWAYAVLGWGGYWGWDPVENASLMPWLTGTAFLHSVMMQEKRGMLKVWNMWLIFATFWLSILGTFLTRSGIISSVHAFAQSTIGAWFGWFLIISLLVFTLFFILNHSHLKTEHKLEALVSRESSFLFNNLLLLVACFTILWGTWYPKISELFQGHTITVRAPYYNVVIVPTALLLLLLTAVGPLLAWRKTSLESLKRNFLFPFIAAIAIGIAMIVFGVRPWDDSSYFYATMAAILSFLVIFTVISEFVRGGRVIAGKGQMNLLAAMVQLWHRNTRRYGGYIVHFGVALVVIGILGTPFNKEVEKEMAFGDKILIGPYTLVCQSYTQDDTPNYGSEWAIINVFRGGRQVTTMYPERRFYKSSGQPQTIPRIYPSLKEDLLLVTDLYLVYEGMNETTGRPIIKAHLNPLVPWIWTGLIVMVFGTILALIPNVSTVRVAVLAPVREPVHAGVGD